MNIRDKELQQRNLLTLLDFSSQALLHLYLGHIIAAKFMFTMCCSEKETGCDFILTELHLLDVPDFSGFHHKADSTLRHTHDSEALSYSEPSLVYLVSGQFVDTYCPSLPTPLVTHH